MTKTFALNTELRPLLEAIAAQRDAPLWVELIPFGEQIKGRDGRSWINDNPQGVVDAFQANSADLPIDIEHATELKAPNGEPAPAVGWIKALEVREGGSVWELVGWNNEGRWLMEDKSYKYLTDHPVGLPDAEVSVSNFVDGAATPWYLLDNSRAIKPLIYQERKKAKFVSMTKDEDEAVFMKKEYRYGVDSRCNVGFFRKSEL